MRTIQHVIVGLVLCIAAACGGGNSSPTAPTPPPTAPPPPQPAPRADIRSTGSSAWGHCLPNLGLGTRDEGACFLDGSIENIGNGCARGTTVIARLYGVDGARVGADLQMGAVGRSLMGAVIRPAEVVAITSLTRVDGFTVPLVDNVSLIPTWTNVAC